MARQRLGKKKHEFCESITGKKYIECLVRGGTEHFWVACNYIGEDNRIYCDWVNYKTGEWKKEK